MDDFKLIEFNDGSRKWFKVAKRVPLYGLKPWLWVQSSPGLPRGYRFVEIAFVKRETGTDFWVNEIFDSKEDAILFIKQQTIHRPAVHAQEIPLN